MELSRRNMITALGLGGIGLTTASCAAGGATTGEAAGTGDVGELSGTVRILTPDYAGNEGNAVLEDDLIGAFTAQHPDVTFEVDYTDWGNLNEKITTGIAGGVLADVVMTGVGWVPPFAHREVFAPFPEDSLSGLNLQEAILAACRYDDGLYALPILLDTRFFIYRKDFFEEAGIAEPPSTLDELREIGVELSGNGRFGMDLFTNPVRQVWQQLVYSHGGQIFDEAGAEVMFDEEPGLQALEYLQRLIADGATSFDVRGVDGQPSPYSQGQVAMALANSTVWGSMVEETPELVEEDKLGFFLMPGVDGPTMLQGGTLVSVAEQSQNKAAAFEFARFLAGPEQVVQTCAFNGGVPNTADTPPNEVVEANAIAQFGVENLEHAVSEGGTPGWMEIRGLVDPAIESALVGQASAAEAITGLAQESRAALDRTL